MIRSLKQSGKASGDRIVLSAMGRKIVFGGRKALVKGSNQFIPLSGEQSHGNRIKYPLPQTFNGAPKGEITFPKDLDIMVLLYPGVDRNITYFELYDRITESQNVFEKK